METPRWHEVGRVISLVGLPGVGKTRAAMEWAASRPGCVLLQGRHAEESAWRASLARAVASRYALCDDVDVLSEARAEELRLALVSSSDTSWLLTSRVRGRWPGAISVTLGLLDLEQAELTLEACLLGRGVRVAPESRAGLVELARRSLGYLPDLDVCAARVELLGVKGARERAPESPSNLLRVLEEVWGELGVAERAMWSTVAHFATPCDATTLARRADGALGDLVTLLDRGVLARHDEEPPRFSMHEALAEFARERGPDAEERARAHGRWVSTRPEVEPRELLAQLARTLERGRDPSLAIALAARAVASSGARASTESLARCDALGEEAPEAPGLARVRIALAHRLLDAGQTDRARALLEIAGAGDLSPGDSARAHALRASIARVAASAERALVSYERALEELDDAEPTARLRVVIERAGALWERGDHEQAAGEMLEALASCRALGARIQEGVVLSNYGVMLHHQGRLDEARAHHALALTIHRELGRTRFEGIASFDLSMLDHECGAIERAIEHAERARRALEEAGDARHLALLEASVGALRARLGLEPGVAFGEIRGRLERSDDLVFSEAVGLYERLASVYMRAEHVAPDERFDDEPYSNRPDEVRLPARLLAEATRALAQEDALLTGGGDVSFRRARSAGWVDLSRRDAYRSIFAALVGRRLAGSPPASLDELFDVGWPDEVIGADSSRNRVHVALSSLRRMGLRGVLQSVDGGYALSEDVPLMRIGPYTSDVDGSGALDSDPA